METRATFGRRGAAPPRSAAPGGLKPAPAAPVPSAPSASSASVVPLRPPPAKADAPPRERPRDPVDEELEEWKRARKKLPLFAWRPIYFMASLCFGLASFVLPDSIDDIVQWPLYALAAVSFYLGIKMRREKRAARRAEKAEAAAESEA